MHVSRASGSGTAARACVTLPPASPGERKLMRLVSLLLSCAIAAAGYGAASVLAADGAYPQRPVRLIIPQSPGGASDTVGRVVAQKLSERLGQQLVADNRPGA